MMANDDAERLLEENFIMTEEDPFDGADDTSIPHVPGLKKYKKKNEFAFTSLWRSPKMGRRKTRNSGKNQGTYKKTFTFDLSSPKMRGRYFKDRESFGSVASVPLSDFDEAKDTLPFLNFQPENSNTITTQKERTALNPKMFFSQTSVNRRVTKPQTKISNRLSAKVQKEESNAVFKPVFENNKFNDFNAFQICSKESPNKAKALDETRKRHNEEDFDDLLDKENLVQDAIYCNGLYPDHGPILSSLSEDTSMYSDSVRGEQFLEDNFNEGTDEIQPRKEWTDSNNDTKDWRDDACGFRNVCRQNEVPLTETTQKVDPSNSIETSIQSFSDRLKLFQPKTTQLTNNSKCTPNSAIPRNSVGSLSNMKTTTKEANKDPKTTMSQEISELEDPASGMKVSNNCIKSNISEGFISKEVDQTIAKVQPLAGETSAYDTTHSRIVDENRISSGVEQNNLKEQLNDKRTEDVELPYRTNGFRSFREKKRFTTTSTHNRSSQKFGGVGSKEMQSKAVDLTIIENKKDKIVDVDTDRCESASQNLDVHTQGMNNSATIDVEEIQNEIKADKRSDSFRAAALRFGKKLEKAAIKLADEVVTNDTNKTRQKTEDETYKAELKNLKSFEVMDNKLTASKVGQIGRNAKKFFQSSAGRVSVASSIALTTSPVANTKERRSSSMKSSRGHSLSSLDTSTPTNNALNTTELEPKKELEPQRQDSNEDTTVTCTSSSASDSCQLPSFAQRSASIFGVTLSKARKNKFSNMPEEKERVKLDEGTIEITTTNNNAKKAESESPMKKAQTTSKAERGVVGKRIQEHRQNENQVKSTNEHRKNSISSNDTCTFGKETEDMHLQSEQEKESSQPVQFHGDEKLSSVDAGAKLNTFNSKEKLKMLSISDRLKMFEQATVRKQASFNRLSSIRKSIRSNLPTSVGISVSPSPDDVAVSMNRKNTESAKNSISGDLRSQHGYGETSPADECNDDDDKISVNEDENEIVDDVSKTLERVRECMDTFRLAHPQPKTSTGTLDKVEVQSNNPRDNNRHDNIDGDTNRPEKKSSKVNNVLKENGTPEKVHNSPLRRAYAARRNFFENVDRKRILSAMSRPLAVQSKSLRATTTDHEEQEIHFFQDKAPDNSEGPPMFVTVDEDFHLKDNISTCLSASEKRSVVCRPDALLYSVSQRAIALMSAKAEESSILSSAKHEAENKESIPNELNQNQLLSPTLKFNEKESKNYRLRSRFTKIKASNNVENYPRDSQDTCNGDVGFSSDDQQTNKFKIPDLSIADTSQNENPSCNNNRALDSSNHFGNHHSVTKSGTLAMRNALKSKGVYDERKGNTIDRVRNPRSKDDQVQVPDDGVRCDEKDKSQKNDLSVQEKEESPMKTTMKVEPSTQKIRSSSIMARRKFFESQFGRIDLEDKENSNEESKGEINHRKSIESTANRSYESKSQRSVGSDVTPLIGADIVRQAEPLVNSTVGMSNSKKRVSSTSMGTLDYSLSSSTSLKPSEVSKRNSYTTTNTYGRSSAPAFEGAHSSAGIQSSKVPNEKKPYLRCF